MWHHQSVFRAFSLPLTIALGALLLRPPVSGAQPRPSKPVRSSAKRATGHPVSATDPLGELESLIQAETAAVQAGAPSTIASAARNLNAQVLSILAQLRLAQGQPAEAIALYRQSLDLQPSTQRRLEFASALMRSGHADEAIAESDAVIAVEPRNAVAWMTRGSALRDTGREKEAFESLNRAMEIRPDTNIAFALGSTLLAMHDPVGASRIFKSILLTSGSDAIWEIAIGDAYRDGGYMEEALSHLKAGLARNPHIAHGEFFLGLTYLQMNQWGPSSESFLHLRRAIAQNPKEYVSNFYLGALESTDGSDLPSSDRHLHAAADADPTQPEVWIYLGTNAVREKKNTDARTYLQKAVDLTGNDERRNNYQVRRAYFALGRLLIAEGDRAAGEALLARYRVAEQAAVAESAQSIAASAKPGEGEQAASLLSAAAASVDARIKPQEAAADPAKLKAQAAAEARLRTLLASSFNDLGTAEARQQQYAAALHDFQQGERWDASSPVLLRNLGVAAFRIDDFVEAARALGLYQQRQASAKEPLDQRSQLMLALSEFSLGRFADAAKHFAPVEPLALQDQRTAYSYAFALARDGHAQEANRLADMLSHQALPPDVVPLVCHLYVDTENYEGSQSCYRKALAEQPGLHLAHYEVGEALIHLDRPADAIPELEEEDKLSPGNPNVQTALAFALLQTSRKDEARTLLSSVTTAHPEYPEGQYEYGKLLLEDGKTADAIPHLELSAKGDSSKDYVHYQLGTAYRKAGRTADAERELGLYRAIKDRNRNANAVPH